MTAVDLPYYDYSGITAKDPGVLSKRQPNKATALFLIICRLVRNQLKEAQLTIVHIQRNSRR